MSPILVVAFTLLAILMALATPWSYYVGITACTAIVCIVIPVRFVPSNQWAALPTVIFFLTLLANLRPRRS